MKTTVAVQAGAEVKTGDRRVLRSGALCESEEPLAGARRTRDRRTAARERLAAA